MVEQGDNINPVLSTFSKWHWASDQNATTDVLDQGQKLYKPDPRHQGFVQYMHQLDTLPMGLIKSVTLLVYVIGMLSNPLLITYMIKYKRYRSPTFALILSLACSDLLTCFGATLMTVFGLHELNGPLWLCKVLAFIVVWGYDTSTLHLILFSILRFYQLVFPLKARTTATSALVAKCCIVCWGFVAITSSFIPTYYKAAVFQYKGKLGKICTGFPNEYQLFMETFYELIPTLLIAGFHLAKYCCLRKRSGMKIGENDAELQQRASTTDTRALVIVIVVYCITAWPQLIHFYIHYVFNIPVYPYHTLLDTVCMTMEYGNSAINPFIYVLCAGSIRRDVISMLRCRNPK